MSAYFKFPNNKAVIFWPVGTGDSTTLILKPNEIIMQIDLHHLEKSDDPNEPAMSIIDDLVRNLPKKGGRPYLALFVLTHPDQDHIRGFSELLRRVHIGEIWHTPKIFRDLDDQESICDDAKAFRREAQRRRSAILANPDEIKSGDDLLVIGHDDVLTEDKYKGLPNSCKARPSDKVWEVDGQDLSEYFHAFIHAPFKDDQAKNKNNTSLALNVVISESEKNGQFFFFGDREYPTIKRIFERTEQTMNSLKDNTPYLHWDVMLCAHHCSKAVMYWQEPEDLDKVYKKDIIDFFDKYSRNQDGYIVASSNSTFSDGAGDNPPHKKARDKYRNIVKPGRFICTHEYPSKNAPQPVVFIIDKNGVNLDDKRPGEQAAVELAATIVAARGAVQPPSVQVGFGYTL
jgi:beta-lactamase superfamily II metal-dependent hydrolase